MTKTANIPCGMKNILGAGRAEADGVMLGKAFVTTEDYKALIHTQDFHVVVGRRGTGKSALFAKVGEHFGDDHAVLLVAIAAEEHHTASFYEALKAHTSTYAQ